jgi:hypothetical protein
MGLLDNLFSKKKPSNGKESARRKAEVFESTFPSTGGQASDRKNYRLERRELLYSVVRESMARVGILSSSYKYKVLSLDPRGRQYMIMMDLPAEMAEEVPRLMEIEAVVAQNAKTRHDIIVTAVYWRINSLDKALKVEKQKTTPPPVLSNKQTEYAETTFQSTFLDSSPADELQYQSAIQRAALNQAREQREKAEISSRNESLLKSWKRNAEAKVEFADTELQLPDEKLPEKSHETLTPIPREFQDTETIDSTEKSQPLSSTQYGDLN